jgi:hypothetical protein
MPTRREDEPQRLGTPVAHAELEHAFLGEIDPDAHRGGLGAVRLERGEPRHVVAGGQHAHVAAVPVLQGLADRDRDVEAGRAGVVRGEGQRRGQLLRMYRQREGERGRARDDA